MFGIFERNQHTTVTVADGFKVEVRPIKTTDAPHLINIFDHMGSESRLRRFNRPVDHLTRTQITRDAEQMAHDIEQMGQGWIVFGTWQGEKNVPLGGIRYAIVGTNTAEISISIRDDVQGLGLGTVLMEMLVREARLAGITTLIGSTQYDNRGMWRLLEQTQFPLKRSAEEGDSYFQLTIGL